MKPTTYEESEVICKNLGRFLGKLYVRQLSRADKMERLALINLGCPELPSCGRLVHTSKLTLVHGTGTGCKCVSQINEHRRKERTGTGSIL